MQHEPSLLALVFYLGFFAFVAITVNAMRTAGGHRLYGSNSRMAINLVCVLCCAALVANFVGLDRSVSMRPSEGGSHSPEWASSLLDGGDVRVRVEMKIGSDNVWACYKFFNGRNSSITPEDMFAGPPDGNTPLRLYFGDKYCEIKNENEVWND